MVSREEEELLDIADNITVFQNGECDGTVIAARDLTPADLRKNNGDLAIMGAAIWP